MVTKENWNSWSCKFQNNSSFLKIYDRLESATSKHLEILFIHRQKSVTITGITRHSTTMLKFYLLLSLCAHSGTTKKGTYRKWTKQSASEWHYWFTSQKSLKLSRMKGIWCPKDDRFQRERMSHHQYKVKTDLPRKARIFLVLNKSHRGWDWAPLVCRYLAMALLRVLPLQFLLPQVPSPFAALSIQALLSPFAPFLSPSVQSPLPAITTSRETPRHETKALHTSLTEGVS